MIRVSFDFSNLGMFKRITERIRVGIRIGFTRAGKDVVKEAQRLIDKTPKSGRLYRIKRGSHIIQHRASAPGEAPANLSGKLRRSIQYRVVGWKEFSFGTNVKYGEFLEFGTKKMAKRPYLVTAVNKQKGNIERIIGRTAFLSIER